MIFVQPQRNYPAIASLLNAPTPLTSIVHYKFRIPLKDVAMRRISLKY